MRRRGPAVIREPKPQDITDKAMQKLDEDPNSQFDALLASSRQLQTRIENSWPREHRTPHLLIAASVSIGVLLFLFF